MEWKIILFSSMLLNDLVHLQAFPTCGQFYYELCPIGISELNQGNDTLFTINQLYSKVSWSC